MPLIKSANTPSSIAAFSLADIARQAAGFITSAKRQANDLISQAQVAGEELRRIGREEGLIEGKTEGMSLGLEEGRQTGHAQALAEHREQLTAAIGALAAAAQEFDCRRLEFEAGVLREVVELSLRIAGKITKRQGELDPQMLERNLAEALKLVIGMHKLRIAIHPTQKAALADAMPRLKLDFPTLEHAELVEDASIAPGGCRLLTRQGAIDATLDEQLNRVAADLLNTSQ
jgi:flagellar assembly protein FliH